MWAEAARYEPEIGQEQREELMGGWRQALDATRNHSRGSG
jgi:ribosome modulation factor